MGFEFEGQVKEHELVEETKYKYKKIGNKLRDKFAAVADIRPLSSWRIETSFIEHITAHLKQQIWY